MKSLKLILSCVAVAATTTVAGAQFDLGYGSGGSNSSYGSHRSSRSSNVDYSSSSMPWKAFKLNAKTKINLNFRNASVDAIIHYLSTASGIAIIKDPGLTGGLTLESPKPQSLNDAFSMLSAVLKLKGYSISKSDSFLLITPSASTGGRGAGGMENILSGNGQPSQNQTYASTVLDVYPIKYASASTIANIINNLYATTGTSATGPIPGGFGQLMSSFLNAAGNNQGNNRRFGGNFNTSGQSGTVSVKATSDDYSNSVIVNAPEAQQEDIADIIARIDRKQATVDQPHVYKLVYAKASDLQSEIQSVINNSTTLGRSSTSTNTRTTSNSRSNSNNNGFRPWWMQQSSSGSSSNASVTYDARTNSLIVTASDDIIAKVTEVVNELDRPANYVSSTWIYTFKYARADVIANQVGMVLGVSGNSTATGGALSGKTMTVSTSTSSSSLSTTTNSQTNTNSSRVANLNLDSQGMNELQQMVNTQNLYSSVSLVAYNDTNSVLVTCPPEDRTILQHIFDQLDVPPKQVLVKALIVEAELNNSDKLGFEWPSLATKFFGSSRSGGTGSINFGYGSDTTSNSTVAGLTYTITAGQYSAFIQAINQDTNLHVISTPSVFTTTNASGQITVAQSLPYETSSSSYQGDTSYSYSYMTIGVELTITPHVSADGYVTMDVTQTANELAGYDTALQNAPEVNERQATSTISVKNGQTAVLGGMIQDNVQDNEYKVPVVGDIPVLGKLFQGHTKIKSKSELMIFLTPYVVNNPAEANELSKGEANSLNSPRDMDDDQKKAIQTIDSVPAPAPLSTTIEPRQTIETLPATPLPPATPVPAIAPASDSQSNN